MVIGKIFIDVAKAVFTTAVRYNRYESKLFQRAYQGVPKSISRGARHGYVAGSVLGSFINQENDGTDDNDNGLPQKIPKFNQARKLYKTRDRYSRRPRCYNPKRRQNY